MNVYSLKEKKYRVTSNAKFIMSTVFLAAIIIGALTTAIALTIDYVSDINAKKEYEAQQRELAILKKKYSFTIGGYEVQATSADEALEKTKLFLNKQVEIDKNKDATIASLEDKYNTQIQASKEITKADIQLYNEFAYAIEHPGSDMTLDDIKMIVNLSSKENVNPHIWLGLVELESKFKSNARSSSSSAMGWGQVIRGTGKYIYEKQLKLGKYNHDLMGTNKKINATISIHYLSYLVKRNGSIETALIRYNGGELGQKYIDIVNRNLKQNIGSSLSQLKN